MATWSLVSGDMAKVYQPRQNNTLAYLGDSITNFNAVVIESFPTQSHQNSRGFGHWLNFFSRQAFHVVGCFGYSGYTSSQILAQAPTALAVNPRFLFVLAGLNSVNTGVSAASIISDLQAIINLAVAQETTVLLATLWPSTATVGIAAELAVNDAVNNWIMQQAAITPGVIVVPWHTAIIDPTTGAARTNYLDDGTHPTTLGAAVLGQAAWAAISPAISLGLADALPYYEGDATNVITNAFNTGTTGKLNGTTNAGVATGWAVTTAGTCTATPSLVAATDGLGTWQQIQVTAGGGTASDSVSLEFDSATLPSSGGQVNQGDTVYAQIEVQTDADFINANYLQLVGRDPSTTNQGTALQAGGSTDMRRLGSIAGVMRTPAFVVSAAHPTIQFIVKVGGLSGGATATARFRRASIKKLVTSDGLP